MSRTTCKEARISQRERLSLVAELLLEGALRTMELEKKAQTDTKMTRQDIRTQPIKRTNLESSKIHVNPM